MLGNNKMWTGYVVLACERTRKNPSRKVYTIEFVAIFLTIVRIKNNAIVFFYITVMQFTCRFLFYGLIYSFLQIINYGNVIQC